jgi:hypothetical protein
MSLHFLKRVHAKSFCLIGQFLKPFLKRIQAKSFCLIGQFLKPFLKRVHAKSFCLIGQFFKPFLKRVHAKSFCLIGQFLKLLVSCRWLNSKRWTKRLSDMTQTVCISKDKILKIQMLNTTFNNILDISWRSVLLVEVTRVPGKKPTDVSQVTDKLYHIMLY